VYRAQRVPPDFLTKGLDARFAPAFQVNCPKTDTDGKRDGHKCVKKGFITVFQ